VGPGGNKRVWVNLQKGGEKGSGKRHTEEFSKERQSIRGKGKSETGKGTFVFPPWIVLQGGERRS